MIRLTQFEFAKIMTRKSIYLALSGLLALLVLYACFGHSGPLNGTSYYKPYEGAITEEKVKAAQDQMQSEGYSEEKNQNRYGIFYEIAIFSPESIKNFTRYDDSGNVMERTVSVSEIHYNKPWGYLLEYIDQFGVLFMMIMILLGLAPVFAEEYALGTVALLRSSKRGRSQIVSAKWMASTLYVVLCVILFTSANLLIYWLRFGNLAGSDTPLQSVGMYFQGFDYEFSPYRLSAVQYYGVQLVTHLAGSLVFACVVLCISALSSTSFVAIVINVAIVGVPYLAFDVLNFNPGWAKWIEEFSFSTMMRATRLFQTPTSYSVFGLELSYLSLYMIIMAVVTIGVILGTYRTFRTREVFS
ncbi:ABC transporter permease subunit [Paenibacillus sp. JNUCC31]|uniref:ABC transporter permease subunit n=1 Tax=Paenibacillus sp. JNUCC-31 TaxID=2777983 RepID=UPI001780067D|nr:ABC transporter permease subunit [Paenibacillus sp. JNUCC-31]QOS76943.1 ABC transporter permease subunit [Paenibacillus sp. JNUCC-31]